MGMVRTTYGPACLSTLQELVDIVRVSHGLFLVSRAGWDADTVAEPPATAAAVRLDREPGSRSPREWIAEKVREALCLPEVLCLPELPPEMWVVAARPGRPTVAGRWALIGEAVPVARIGDAVVTEAQRYDPRSPGPTSAAFPAAAGF